MEKRMSGEKSLKGKGEKHVLGNDELLCRAATDVSSETGRTFFDSLVTFLARAVDARFALAGELETGRKKRIRTCSVYADGSIVDGFTYDLKGTPCENVVGKKLCFYPEKVREKFPDDVLLKDMGVESYIGTPLFDSRNNPIGLLSVMDSKPIKEEDRVKALFAFFSVRAASELERMRTEKNLRTERTEELIRINRDLEKEIKERKKAEKKLIHYQKQLQSLASEMSLIEEREKRRIATELHDCVGQTLALARIKLGMLQKNAPSEDFRKNVAEIQNLIEQTIRETRTLTFELCPPILYELGFDQAVKWLVDEFHEKYGINTTIDNDGSDKPIDPRIRFFLFQAIRELMLNIVKHSGSRTAVISIERIRNKLQIKVSDNGSGINKTRKTSQGFGLFNIRERMIHINGSFDIKSSRGKGTTVTLVAPFNLSEKSGGRGLI
jgi:signal transduction histidine kinase